MQDKNRYFEEALSDFVHDVASGGAIRHLVDSGYSLKQITEKLTYPEKPEKIQKTAHRYMVESGMLTYDDIFEAYRVDEGGCNSEKTPYASTAASLPGVTSPVDSHPGFGYPKQFSIINISGLKATDITDMLYKKTALNSEEKSYVSCPFGLIPRDLLKEELSFLSMREWDYIDGILWEKRPAYHRLTNRMREISAKLLFNGYSRCEVVFLNTKEIIR